MSFLGEGKPPSPAKKRGGRGWGTLRRYLFMVGFFFPFFFFFFLIQEQEGKKRRKRNEGVSFIVVFWGVMSGELGISKKREQQYKVGLPTQRGDFSSLCQRLDL